MKIKPNTEVYESMIHLCAHHGRMASALQFEETLELELGPSMASRNCIFVGYALVGSAQEESVATPH